MANNEREVVFGGRRHIRLIDTVFKCLSAYGIAEMSCGVDKGAP